MKSIVIQGFCPVLNQEYSITQEYLEVFGLESSQPQFIKGRFICEYNRYNLCKHTDDCPLRKLAPNEL